MDFNFILQSLKAIAALDMRAMPAIMFQSALRRKLQSHFTADEAEQIVVAMEVSLPPESLSREECEELADVFHEIIVKMYKALDDEGFQYPGAAICALAARMNLKLS